MKTIPKIKSYDVDILTTRLILKIPVDQYVYWHNGQQEMYAHYPTNTSSTHINMFSPSTLVDHAMAIHEKMQQHGWRCEIKDLTNKDELEADYCQWWTCHYYKGTGTRMRSKRVQGSCMAVVICIAALQALDIPYPEKSMEEILNGD